MKLADGHALAWPEIDLAPETPGVYAWYSRLIVSRADIEAVIRRIEDAKHKDVSSARAEVEAALERFIFSPYQESPYKVSLRGQLKPKYSGEVFHEPASSDSLVERLIETPERFRVIAEILKSAAPWFTAPLYIGMASNLRKRLLQHKTKIVELRDSWSGSIVEVPPEAGFANQVVARGFDPTNLFVHVAQIHDATGEHNDIENILNRINYPIFGRN